MHVKHLETSGLLLTQCDVQGSYDSTAVGVQGSDDLTPVGALVSL